MKISHAELDQIRQTDLPKFMMENGLRLKQISPFSFRGLCPFHDDKNPSLNVNLKGKSWLWYCFGCNAGGDLIKYVMLKQGTSFTEAVRILLPERNGDERVVSDTNALTDVAHYYHETLKEDKSAQEYLAKRGLLDPHLIKEYTIGFSNGTLPRDPELASVFHRLGILNAGDREHFSGCVTFPIEDTAGNIVSLYGRNISNTQHLYLKGPHNGVFNARCVKGARRLFLTESIIDAVSLIKLGLMETIALYGTNGFTADHERLISDSDLRELYLCLDNDEAGRKAVKRLAEKIPASVRLFNITLPDGVKDANDFLLAGKTKEEFLSRTEEFPRPGELTQTDEDWQVTEEQNQILFQRNGTSYRIRGLATDRFESLKVAIKVSNREGDHLDTLDLYQARARTVFSKMTEKLVGVKSHEVERDLKAIVDHLERFQAKRLDAKAKNGSCLHQMTEAERTEALAFLKDPNLIERITADAWLAGHVGEEDNFLLGYLVSISRKLKEPLGLLIISQSAAGKTALQDRVLFFTPPEDSVKLTRLTDQSLFYQEENALVHKLLAIEEEEGAQGAHYSIRHLLSANGLVNMATMKDEASGEFRSKNWHVRGPTAIMITTTNSEINYETYNRFVIITVDESQRQTIAILKTQRSKETLEGMIQMRSVKALQTLHHNAQRLLRPLEIVNPYAERLTFTDSILRARREQVKYLTLIKAVALLRQYQKDVRTGDDGKEPFPYIEVDRYDIGIANRLAQEFLVKGLDDMSPQARKLLPHLLELRDKRAGESGKDPLETPISQREMREYTRWSNYQLRKQVRELVELEYLIPVSGGRGKQFTYLLAWDGLDGSKSGIELQPSDNL